MRAMLVTIYISFPVYFISENQAPNSLPPLPLRSSAEGSLRQRLERSGVLIDSALLHRGAEIGSGCFGKVYKGQLAVTSEKDVTYQPVAIKTLRGDYLLTYSVFIVFSSCV